jgi:integrase
MRFGGATLNVSRKKSGTPSTHPLSGTDLRALRRLQKEQESGSAYIFVNERGAPFDHAGFHRLVKRAGREAKLPFPVHAHMLRYTAGYNPGQRRQGYPLDPSLFGPQGHQAYRAIH